MNSSVAHMANAAPVRYIGAHMSAASKKLDTPLAKAAAALEIELLEYEKVVAELKRMNVGTEKTMHRAKDLLEECAAGEQRMAERLQVFAAAMQSVQVRQQECIAEAVAAATRIQERVEKRAALLERFAALGERARALNEPVAQLEAKEGGASEVAARTESVVVEAEALGVAAKTDEWEDIAREATTLKQQLLSARNKILVSERNLAARTPS